MKKLIKEQNERGERWYYESNDEIILHREDGPAVTNYQMKMLGWFYEGKFLTFENWCKKLNKTDEEIVKLKLEYGENIYNGRFDFRTP